MLQREERGEERRGREQQYDVVEVALGQEQEGAAAAEDVVDGGRVDAGAAAGGVGLDGVEVGFPVGGRDVPASLREGEHQPLRRRLHRLCPFSLPPPPPPSPSPSPSSPKSGLGWAGLGFLKSLKALLKHQIIITTITTHEHE